MIDTVNKSDVLAIIARRKRDCWKIKSNPDYARSIRDRAAGAWSLLVSLEMEIEEKGTKQERDEYPTFF